MTRTSTAGRMAGGQLDRRTRRALAELASSFLLRRRVGGVVFVVFFGFLYCTMATSIKEEGWWV